MVVSKSGDVNKEFSDDVRSFSGSEEEFRAGGWMLCARHEEYPAWIPDQELLAPPTKPKGVNGNHSAASVAPALAVSEVEVEAPSRIGPWPLKPECVGQPHPASGWYDEDGDRTTIDPDFRKDLLPGGWVGEMVKWAARSTHAPPLFHVAAGLTYAAFELARRGWYFEGVGNEKGPSLWTVVLANSSSGKSTAIRRLELIEHACFSQRSFPEMLRDPFSASALFMAEGSGPGILAAVENRVYKSQREELRTCVLFKNDEMRSLFETANREDGFLNVLVQIADQPREYRINQRGIQKGEDAGRKGVMPNPAFSMFLVSSPAQLQGRITDTVTAGGFAGRFLWLASPKDWKVRWSAPPEPSAFGAAMVANRLQRWLERIANRGPASAVVVFEPHGKTMELHDAWYHRLVDLSPEPIKEAIFQRLPAHTQRLACVIAAVETEGGTPGRPIYVTPEHYMLAKNIAVEGYQGVLHMLEIAKPKVVQQENQLVAFARKRGREGLPLSEAMAVLGRSVGDITKALRALEDFGLLATAMVRRGGRGRPSVYIWASEFAPDPKLFVLDGNKKLLFEAQYKTHIVGGKTRS